MSNEATLNPEAADPVVTAGSNGDYAEDSVQVFRGIEHIRKRPDMYIGNTGFTGLHHLVNELVGNSLDEALAGYCRNIHVRIHKDGSLSVADDGRGIPVEEHAIEKRPTLEVVMTVVGAGAKFDHGTYRVSVGLHGMGAKAVTALSEWSEARVQRNGRTYVQEYERGKYVTEVKDIGPANRTGTTVTFKPDPEIFRDLTFDFETLRDRLRDLAFLNRGLNISLTDERIGKEETFRSERGLVEFVEWINGKRPGKAAEGEVAEAAPEDTGLHPPVLFEKTLDDVLVEVALQYTAGEEDRWRCYANNAHNVEGGTHLTGFQRALTRTLGAYGEKEQLFKTVKPEGKDFREGLTVVLSVKAPDPKFDSQEKRKLVNPEISGIVERVVGELLAKYLEEHPKEAQRIARKVATAAEAREAARKAKDAVRQRKSILSGGGLPGKLFDCTSRNREGSELFLVEGNSAGGSAESGRDRRYQAVLPLRGKPLNVEKSKLENLLKNEEISSLISAIGIDIGNLEEYDVVKEKLRYARIIILTDADVDGQHIRTLLLTFFYRQMTQLVANGHIYVARPPLYKVTQKKKVHFVETIEQMTREMMERGLSGTRLTLLPKAGAAARVLEGDDLAHLVKLMNRVEHAVENLEKSGLNPATFLPRATARGLPTYRVVLLGNEHFFSSLEEVQTFRAEKSKALGRELVVGGEEVAPANGNAEAVFVEELHEAKLLNRSLEELRRQGLDVADLLPAPQVAGREPAPRYTLEAGDQKRQLPHLRELAHEVRRLGERGLSVTRFKGLGEMDPEELWDTTLDPETRTLMQVKLDDAIKADELFRILMGEKVEPRRDFIVEHARNVKDVDRHAS